MRRGFRARFRGIDRVVISVDDVLVHSVLNKRRRVGRSEEALVVGLVLREQQRDISLAVQISLTQFGVRRRDCLYAFLARDLLQRWLGCTGPPGPGVAKPQGRQDIYFRGLRSAITHADLDKDVFRRLLGIFHEDVEVAVLVEDAGIQQFVLHVVSAASLVVFLEIFVGICRLRILVQVLHVGMRWRAVEVKIVFLNILAVVGLAVRQAVHAFLEDGVFAVPKGYAEAQELLHVADSGHAVFAPVIGARAGLVMSEVVPGISVLAVVLAHSTPLPLAQVRPPLSPGRLVGG